MSILSDRRSLREIGGFRAYIRQVGWSLWWRTRPVESGAGQAPPSLLEEPRERRTHAHREARGPLPSRHIGGPTV